MTPTYRQGADLLQLLGGTGAVVLVGWLPGLMLLLAGRPAAGLLRNLALAPVVSLGLLMAWGLVVSALGHPVRPVTVLPVALGGPAIALGVASARHRFRWRPGGRTRLAVGWPDGAGLSAAVVVPLFMWLRATRLATFVPPNDDGTHHGLFAERVLHLGTLRPGQVAVGDVLTGQPSTSYYPLALHLATAMASGVSGVPVGTALDLLVIGLACVALPLGIFVLTRRLFPAEPLAAPGAALLSVAFPAFPYYVSYWGGLTMIAGIALVPAVVDAMAGIAEDARILPGGALLGFAWAGLFTVHVTELVTVALLAVPLVLLPPWPGPAAAHLRGIAARWPIGALVVGAVIAAQFGQFVKDAEQRREVARLLPLDPAQAVRQISTVFLGTAPAGRAVLTLLFALGIVVAVRRLWATGWLVAAVLFAALSYLSARRTGLGDLLTVPWYGRWDRVVVNHLYFVATYGGLGAAVAVRVTTAAGRRLRLPRLAGGAVATVTALLLAGFALAPEYEASNRQVSYSFRAASLAGPAERAAFAWLAAHVRPGERVLNDITDGSGWMYPLDGVPPLFAMAAHAYPVGAWGDRVYLRANAGRLATDARARRAADTWHVRYAYVGPRLFPRRRPLLSAADLAASGAWRRVYDRGGATIFERVGHG
jgi:hypothetical protein